MCIFGAQKLRKKSSASPDALWLFDSAFILKMDDGHHDVDISEVLSL